MTQYGSNDARTQATGGAGYPQESPTEVVGPQRPSGGQPYRSDATIVHPAKQPEPSFAWLVVFKGKRLGDILRLNKGDTTLGREADCEIVLDDEYASRRHVKVRLEPDPEAGGESAFFAYDLATANGTFVNGAQILKVKLVDGDRLQIGETVFVFKKV